MNIGAVNPWNKVEETNILKPKAGITEVSSEPKESGAAAKDEEVITKISVNEKGERIMIFMQGDKVIRTVKLGSSEEMLTNQEENGEQQKYVDNGMSDVGLMLNASG